MGRIPRWRYTDGVYHVYNRSIGRVPILNQPEDRDRFVELLKEKLSKYRLNVYHYCIILNGAILAKVLDKNILINGAILAKVLDKNILSSILLVM